MNINTWIPIGVLSYLVASAALGFYLFKPTRWRQWLIQGFLAIAIVFQAHALYLAIDVGQMQNLSSTHIFAMISFEAMVLLWLAAFSLAVMSLFLVVIPLAIISLVCMYFLPGQQLFQTSMDTGLFYHIMFSLMTFGVLALAFVQAIVILLQNKLLRSGRALRIGTLFPPIETMERLLFLFIYVGFVMLSIIIISALPVMNLHSIAAMIAWVVFACLCVLRRLCGWQASRAAAWTILGYVVLLLCVFGTTFLMHA